MVWEPKTKKSHNSISLDVRCDEGRQIVQVGIDLDEKERAFLLHLLKSAEAGQSVMFAVECNEEGEHVVKFTFGAESDAPAH